jgi:4-hydroxybenzoyl-CoA thioesterase
VIVFDRPIKFEEVDAANIVFFARFVTYAHEAMESFFDALEGGYAGLILERHVGFPAVHVEITFTAPARYGDVLRIETRVARLGNRSAVLWYRMHHAGSGPSRGGLRPQTPGSGLLACELWHTVVTTDLRTLTSCDMPADVRALLEQHLEPPGS